MNRWKGTWSIILSISETAGLGMRAKQDPSFTSQFTAKSDAVASIFSSNRWFSIRKQC
ncbi:MAG: hypothetical protein ACLT33_08025 [Lachnospira pectinoschiza]